MRQAEAAMSAELTWPVIELPGGFDLDVFDISTLLQIITFH